jgi:competence protein ComEC
MNRKRFSLLVLALTAALLGVVLLAHSAHRTKRASIAMLDIGQGDSFLIESSDGTRMLIDGGPANGGVLSELAKRIPWNDRAIDVVIATHPDADHIGGLSGVLDHYHVGLFLTSEVASDTQTERQLLQTLSRKGIPSYYVRHGMHVVLDPSMHFDVFFPDRDTSGWETNTASVVGRLSIGTASALFTGDSPESIEHYLVQTIPDALSADLLKLGHHGSKYSSSTEFLKAVSPSLALISAGVNNRYGHPAPETLSRLSALGIPWVSTQDHGTTVFISDGVSWNEETAR